MSGNYLPCVPVKKENAGVIISDLTGPGTRELNCIEDGDAAKAFLIILNRQ